MIMIDGLKQITDHRNIIDKYKNLLYKVGFIISYLVPPVGVEPTCLSAHDFESCVSANSTTAAFNLSY